MFFTIIPMFKKKHPNKKIIYKHISFPSKVKECVKESPFTRKRPVYRESRRKVKDRKNMVVVNCRGKTLQSYT